MDGNGWIRVWDPVVRLGHWIVVAAFFTAYFTEDDFLTVHVWAGYLVGAVVVVRLVWGLVGTRYARFSDFVRSPAVVLGYLGDMVRRRERRYLGHNPAGGAMILALLLSLAVTVTSGIVLYAYDEGAGPLAPLLVETASGRGAYEEAEDVWEEIHEVFSNLTLLLVVLHVAGVVFASLVHRENLVKAMVTGRKRVEP